MLNYYRRTLIQLFKKVQNIYSDPWAHPEACLEVQTILIKRIVYVEKRIQSRKKLIKAAKKELATKRDIPFTKKQSKSIKSRIKYYEQVIQEYRILLFILRNIGDAVAFTFVSRWDIKPMSFKETAGYISGKSGLTAEKQFLRFFFQQALGADGVLPSTGLAAARAQGRAWFSAARRNWYRRRGGSRAAQSMCYTRLW